MNVQKVLLGTLLIQPELASYALPVLDISDFAPDVQPIFAALQGFWISTGILDTVQICARYPAQKAAVMGCVEEYSAECVRPTRSNVEAWVRLVQEQAALNRFQSLALESANAAYDDLPEIYSRMGETLTIGKNSPDFQSIGELTEEYIRNKDKAPQYIPSGIPVLDRNLNLSPGNLFINRTTRMYEASPEEYAACIRQALKNDSIPVFILYTVYHLLHDYMPH